MKIDCFLGGRNDTRGSKEGSLFGFFFLEQSRGGRGGRGFTRFAKKNQTVRKRTYIELSAL